MPPGAIIVPFEMRHLQQMRLHPRQQATFDLFPDYQHLLSAQAEVGPAFAVIRDRIVWCAFGALELCPGMAEAWMLRDDRIDTYTIPLARNALAFFDVLGTDMALRRCQITVQVAFKSAVRFAKWVGFEVEGVLRNYGVTHDDHYMMARYY